VSCEECFCDEKIYGEYLECKTYSVASRSVAGRRLVEQEAGFLAGFSRLCSQRVNLTVVVGENCQCYPPI
jgi:hypothetical protein